MFFLTLSNFLIRAQKIDMYFPKFAGKEYSFFIFQGKNQKKILKGQIPSDGKFTIEIPKEYSFYRGMSRWLLTNSEEGGGLDMYIPGRDFSVSCLVDRPDESNISFVGNPDNILFIKTYKEQEYILGRYRAMLEATKVFNEMDRNYSIFIGEYKTQLKKFNSFHSDLKAQNYYVSQLIQVINVTNGISEHLFENNIEKAKDIENYMANNLDWKQLYTSGHWSTVIYIWINMNIQLSNDTVAFSRNFKKISDKIVNSDLPDLYYEAYVERVTYYLTEAQKDDFLKAIRPIVMSSRKILSYEGSLSVFRGQ